MSFAFKKISPFLSPPPFYFSFLFLHLLSPTFSFPSASPAFFFLSLSSTFFLHFYHFFFPLSHFPTIFRSLSPAIFLSSYFSHSVLYFNSFFSHLSYLSLSQAIFLSWYYSLSLIHVCITPSLSSSLYSVYDFSILSFLNISFTFAFLNIQ